MATRAKRGKSLSQLRTAIDRADKQIVRLLNERATHAVAIGELKSSQGMDVYSPEREEEVVERVLKASKGPLEDRCLRVIFRELMSGSRALQKQLKVSYLGPAYSFSYLAALVKFGESVTYVPSSTIRAIFHEVHRGHVDFGVVPVENSTDGSIADTLDMFTEANVKICGEVKLKISHHLLAQCEQGEIRRVYSRPQALSQCRNWLAQNVPSAQLIDVASTARAAELATREPYAAAVASAEAAAQYGLRIRASNIEDVEHNATRFVTLGNQSCRRTGKDRTALMLNVADRPGALYDTLTPLKRHQINMTWIESHPSKHARGEYHFFVDIQGHAEDAKVKRALAAVSRKCQLTVLGSFPRAELEE